MELKYNKPKVGCLCCVCPFVYAVITCDPLANVTDGHYERMNCTTQKGFYNETCKVTCDFGYVLERRYCLLDEQQL